MTTLVDRIHGALSGIALGDALGAPAEVHRTTRSSWVRSRLWGASAELDAQRVARPLQPFVLDSLGSRRIAPTDDAETAALALTALLTVPAQELGADGLFEVWRTYSLAEDAWGGVAERAAASNAVRGLRPPQTGTDHPADSSDSAVVAGLALGLAHPGDPARARAVATRWGSITHSSDGLDACLLFAAIAADLSGGAALGEAITAGIAQVPAGGWLEANLAAVAELAPASPSDLIAQAPVLLELLSPATYSSAGVAPETVPLALAVALATYDHPHLAIPLALMFARSSDSVPAMVGGLIGAGHGVSVFQPTWVDDVDRLDGILYPGLAGASLRSLSTATAEWTGRVTR